MIDSFFIEMSKKTIDHIFIEMSKKTIDHISISKITTILFLLDQE